MINIETGTAITWRPMTQKDAIGLARFEVACAELDGRSAVLNQDGWVQRLSKQAYNDVNSVIGLDETGDVAAVGWIHYQEESSEVQGFVDGRIHPLWRGKGVGSALLGWLEMRAVSQLDLKAEGRKRVLRILYYDRGEDALALFAAHGYHFQFSEIEMRAPLLPDRQLATLPEGFRFYAYTPSIASCFYDAYRLSFQTRSGKLSSREYWSRHFSDLEDDEFVPDQSMLIKAGDEPAAFVIVHRYDRDDGVEGKEFWVAQMGVVPEHRRKGLATSILTKVMHNVVKQGYPELTLTVNVNNPNALRVYQRTGFVVKKTMTLLRKELDRPNS